MGSPNATLAPPVKQYAYVYIDLLDVADPDVGIKVLSLVPRLPQTIIYLSWEKTRPADQCEGIYQDVRCLRRFMTKYYRRNDLCCVRTQVQKTMEESFNIPNRLDIAHLLYTLLIRPNQEEVAHDSRKPIKWLYNQVQVQVEGSKSKR